MVDGLLVTSGDGESSIFLVKKGGAIDEWW
jgi:hypothetical protein